MRTYRRTFIAWGLAVISLGLIAAFLFILPYQEITYYINRRNGEIVQEISYLTIWRSREITSASTVKLLQAIPKEDQWIPFNRLLREYPWSDLSEGYQGDLMEGKRGKILYDILFGRPYEIEREGYPPDFIDRIHYSRIPLWIDPGSQDIKAIKDLISVEDLQAFGESP